MIYKAYTKHHIIIVCIELLFSQVKFQFSQLSHASSSRIARLINMYDIIIYTRNMVLKPFLHEVPNYEPNIVGIQYRISFSTRSIHKCAIYSKLVITLSITFINILHITVYHDVVMSRHHRNSNTRHYGIARPDCDRTPNRVFDR